MNKKIMITFIFGFALVISACAKTPREEVSSVVSSESTNEEVSSITSSESTNEVSAEMAKEEVLSWYKSCYGTEQAEKEFVSTLVENKMIDSSDAEDLEDENRYSVEVLENSATVYGKECYLLNMFLKGRHFMSFAVDKENGEIYMDDGVNFFLPLKNLKILFSSEHEKDAERLLEKKITKDKKADIVYLDTIEKEGVTYFLYGKYHSSSLQDVYVVDIETEESYLWDRETNTLIAKESIG